MKELGCPVLYDAGVKNAGSTDMGTSIPFAVTGIF
jgi:hypothetical protein